MTQQRTLNIPIKLLKRFREDKSKWELLAFAVCIKMLRGSSGIHPDVMEVRRMMQCSHYKAIRMIEGAKKCGRLFYYNAKKNFLVARSFTKGHLERRTHYTESHTYTAYQSYCFKFNFEAANTSVSHIAVSRMLRDKLLTYAIKAKQRKNDFLLVAKHSTRSDRAKALSVKKLGRIAGVHRSTVSRRINKLAVKGEVDVTRHDFIKIADYRTNILMTTDYSLLRRRSFLHHCCLVVRDANEYRLTSNNTDVFTNVIFNHVKRRVRNYSEKEYAFAQFD